jgi:hypothetical protein
MPSTKTLTTSAAVTSFERDLADRQGEHSGEQDDGDLERGDVGTDPT